MNDATELQLMRAYELIEAGKLDDARSLLEPILVTDKNNPDAWWIYAHAVTDVTSARRAIDNVLRLDPEYPGAQELRAQMGEVGAPAAMTAPPPPVTVPDLPPARTATPAASSTPPTPRTVAASSTPAREPERRSNLLPILGLVAVIAVILIVLTLLQQPAADEVVIPTQIAAGSSTGLSETAVTSGSQSGTDAAAQPTAATFELQPTSDSAVVSDATEAVSGTDAALVETDVANPTGNATLEGTTPDSTPETGAEGDLSGLSETLVDLNVVDGGIEIVDTSVGRTLLVTFCSTPGAPLRSDVPNAMFATAAAVNEIEADAEYIGVRAVNCEADNALLRTIVVSSQDLAAWSNGSLTQSQFQSRWQSI